jgi:hypothetical protein
MQYALDTHSELSELFLTLRSIILNHGEIKELRNAKQTSYKDRYSTICMIRVRKGVIRLSFANGAKMTEKFPQLRGEAKIVRYLEFTTEEDVNTALLRALIEESLLLNIENDSLKQLKTHY